MDYFFLGDPELVTAFRFVGIGGIPVQRADDALDAFRRMTEGYGRAIGTVQPSAIAGADAGTAAVTAEVIAGTESCRVLIMTEEVADWLGDSLVQWQLSDRYPLVVEIPGLLGRHPGRKTLVESIREAIGVHV